MFFPRILLLRQFEIDKKIRVSPQYVWTDFCSLLDRDPENMVDHKFSWRTFRDLHNDRNTDAGVKARSWISW